MRDRLIELLNTARVTEVLYTSDGEPLESYKVRAVHEEIVEHLADHLLANGVIVLPCKVGDTVYYINGAYYNSKRQTVRPIKVTEISWKCDRGGRDLDFALIANGTRYKFSSIGKTIFLTKEEAERALKGGEADA